jgi:hypothetical protein
MYMVPHINCPEGMFMSHDIFLNPLTAHNFSNKHETVLDASITCFSLDASLHHHDILLSIRIGTPGRHPKTSGFDVAEGRI